MAKRSVSFTFSDETIVQLDRICERCGCTSYAEVLSHSLGVFDTLTELASDGVGLIHVEAQPIGQRGLQSTVTMPQIVQAFERAREQERVLGLPITGRPEPIIPAVPAPTAPPRRWWRWWD